MANTFWRSHPTFKVPDGSGAFGKFTKWQQYNVEGVLQDVSGFSSDQYISH